MKATRTRAYLAGPSTGKDLDDYPEPLAQRVEITAAGCWIWTGSYDHRGRPKITYEGQTWASHRLFYLLAYGALPEPPIELDHLCRDPRCVNARHLEEVDRGENMARRYALMTHCKRGHEFTEANTYEIYGRRVCRKCQAMRSAAYKARKDAS